jgi:zinc protease
VTRADVMRVYNQYLKGKNYLMTSVVPKGQLNLAVASSQPATVWIEQVVSGVQNENVTRGEEANIEKTKTKYDRSEPPFGETPLFKMPEVWTGKASNGMAIVGIENNEIPIVSFDITIPGGHAYDPIDKSGIASLVAQMMNQGTAKKTPAELEEAIGLLGSSLSFQCTNEEIRLTGSSLSRNFEATMALAKEMLLEPRWDVAEYDRLKKALETNLKGLEANAQAIAQRNANRLLYGTDHIFGMPVAGTLQTTASITLQDLKNYYSEYFSPVNATLHVAGAAPKTIVEKAANQLTQNWTSKTVRPAALGSIKTAQAGNLYFIDFPGAKQSVIYAGRLAVTATDPNSTKIEFANEILGGGSSGKLFQTLRIEKGYTYGAYSFLGKSKEVAPFMVTTSVRSNATLPSLEIIQQMVRDYGNNFTDQEVTITKNKVLKGNTLAYEALNSKLGLLREITKYGKSKKFVEEDQKLLMSMSLSDFKSTIEKFMSEKDIFYLVVGDKATQLEEIKKLKGKVIELDINGNLISQSSD